MDLIVTPFSFSDAQAITPTKLTTSDITNQINTQSCHDCCSDATKVKIQEAISGLQANFPRPQIPQSDNETTSCPPYSCTINLSASFSLKHESLDPDAPPLQGTWIPVLAELRGTILLIHDRELACSRRRPFHLLSRALSKAPPPYPSTRAYSLQSGKAGIAPDYLDKSFVLRVRAERDQFLLATDSSDVLLEWVAGLNQGIDISAPLEIRSMPGYQSLRKLSQSQGRERDSGESSGEEG